MNSRQPQKEPQRPAEASQRYRAAVIGRRLGILVYWLLLTFVVSASALSIIPEAFGIGPGGPEVDEEFCAREIEALKADLLGQAGVLISSDPKTRADRLERWDARFRELDTGCGVLERARTDLETLRSNLAAASARFFRSQGKLIKRIDNAVGRYARGQTIQPPEEP